MKEQIENLLREMNQGIYEKQQEISLSLLAAVAGESILLLGPPGVAKSMVARRLKLAFLGARSFEYLMSRFSTPDEIFGPVSISRLKQDGVYERSVDGYLPTSDVVFLDEIWKAGPAIQNTLLTVVNEKIFRNGTQEYQLPLKLLIAASNELPAKGEGLEALWDRFVIRLESTPIRDERNFEQMLIGEDRECEVSEKWKITNAQYQEWQSKLSDISISHEAMSLILQIRKQLRAVNIDPADERRRIYVSDRRWKQIVKLLRTSAMLQNRDEVQIVDIFPIYHCLWQEPEERDEVRNIVIRTLFLNLAQQLATLKDDLAKDILYHHCNRDYVSEIEAIADQLQNRDQSIQNNIFIGNSDKIRIKEYLKDFYKELAFTRQDTSKLYE